MRVGVDQSNRTTNRLFFCFYICLFFDCTRNIISTKTLKRIKIWLPSFRRGHEIDDDDSDGGFDPSGPFLPGGSSSVFVLVFGSQRQFDVVGRHLLAQRQRLPPQGAIHVVQRRSQTGARRPVRPVLLRGQLQRHFSNILKNKKVKMGLPVSSELKIISAKLIRGIRPFASRLAEPVRSGWLWENTWQMESVS